MSALRDRVRRLEQAGRGTERVVSVLFRSKRRRQENAEALAEGERLAERLGVRHIVVSLPPSPPSLPPGGMDLAEHLDRPWPPKPPPGTPPS